MFRNSLNCISAGLDQTAFLLLRFKNTYSKPRLIRIRFDRRFYPV